MLMDKTFGFDTAVEEAQRAINSAYIEVHNCTHSWVLICLFFLSWCQFFYFPCICFSTLFMLTEWLSLSSQAHSAYRGIGVVKLMGRSSGYIAMHASLASGQIDICLIPEVTLLLDAKQLEFFWALIWDHLLHFQGSF